MASSSDLLTSLTELKTNAQIKLMQFMAELVSHKLEVVNAPGGIPAKTVTWGNPAAGASGTVDFPAKDTRQLQAAAQP